MTQDQSIWIAAGNSLHPEPVITTSEQVAANWRAAGQPVTRVGAKALIDTVNDTQLLNALRDESWDLRCFDIPCGDDADIGWRVVGHWQAKPHERTIGEVYHDDPRAAIRDAIAKTSQIPSALSPQDSSGGAA